MLLGLNFVIVHVPDVEQARTFYTEKLGLVVDNQQSEFVQFKQPMGNGAIFALGKGDVSTQEGIELWWFVNDADSAYAELVAQDVEIASKPVDEPFGRTFSIKDPAGNPLYMLQLAQRD